ncbi:hypothetical protein ABK040_011598 [Willaertia magna]
MEDNNNRQQSQQQKIIPTISFSSSSSINSSSNSRDNQTDDHNNSQPLIATPVIKTPKSPSSSTNAGTTTNNNGSNKGFQGVGSIGAFSPVFPNIEGIDMILLGTSGSGKSTIINQFFNHQFTEEYIPTQLEHYEKLFLLNEKEANFSNNNNNNPFGGNSGNNEISFHVTEIGGRKELLPIQLKSIKEANAFLFVFSIYDKKENIEESLAHWIGELKSHFITLEHVPIVLVLNKKDLEDEIAKEQEGSLEKQASLESLSFLENYAMKNQIPFLYVSAKDEHVIQDLFKIHFLREWMKKHQNLLITTRTPRNRTIALTSDIENQMKNFARENDWSALSILLQQCKPSTEVMKKLLFISILHKQSDEKLKHLWINNVDNENDKLNEELNNEKILLDYLIEYNRENYIIPEGLQRIEMLLDEELNVKANLLLFALMENNRLAFNKLLKEGLSIKPSKLPNQQNLLLIMLQSLMNVEESENDNESDLYLTYLFRKVTKMFTKELQQLVNIPSNIENEIHYPIHYAIQLKSKIVTEWLINNGAKLTARDSYGKTPLHLAIECGAIDLVKCLLENGANWHEKVAKRKISVFGSLPNTEEKNLLPLSNLESSIGIEKDIEMLICEDCPKESKEGMLQLLGEHGLVWKSNDLDWKELRHSEFLNDNLSTDKVIETSISFYRYFIKLQLSIHIKKLEDNKIQLLFCKIKYRYLLNGNQDENQLSLMISDSMIVPIAPTSLSENTLKEYNNPTNINFQQITLQFNSLKTGANAKCQIDPFGNTNLQKPLKNELFIVVGGSQMVGKSSLLMNYVHNIFVEQHLSSFEELYTKELLIHEQPITLHLLDMAAHNEEYLDERFLNADAFIFVYSLDQFDNSLQRLYELLKEIKQIRRKNLNEIPILLVQNKTDTTNIENQDKFDLLVKEKVQSLYVDVESLPIYHISARNIPELKNLFENLLIQEIIQKKP